MPTHEGWDRREVLRGAAMMAGAAAFGPLLGEPAVAHAGPGEPRGDADALFKAGRFEEAGRAYERILREDPGNLHAARQRGYVGLLSNRFPEAEQYLGRALELAPGDKPAHQLLADCYTRQDKLAASVPHWQAADVDIYAQWLAAVRGTPYQVHGDLAQVPWHQLDPIPMVEASVNGGPPKRFAFYTGAPWVGMSKPLAEEAGLREVAKQKIEFLNGFIWQYFGVLDSFRVGGIELRNIPVEWSESAGDGAPADIHDGDGMLGTWFFYHFLTTFDYAGRSLILRRRTPETAAKARAHAARAGARPLPLWLSGEHNLHSRGSIAGSGARVVSVNFGGIGEGAAGTSVETAQQLRIRIDTDRPIETFGHSHPAVVYPCYPAEIRLGNAVARDVYCFADAGGGGGGGGLANASDDGGLLEFDTLGLFGHAFWKPFHITLDFTDMHLYIAPGKAG